MAIHMDLPQLERVLSAAVRLFCGISNLIIYRISCETYFMATYFQGFEFTLNLTFDLGLVTLVMPNDECLLLFTRTSLPH